MSSLQKVIVLLWALGCTAVLYRAPYWYTTSFAGTVGDQNMRLGAATRGTTVAPAWLPPDRDDLADQLYQDAHLPPGSVKFYVDDLTLESSAVASRLALVTICAVLLLTLGAPQRRRPAAPAEAP